MTEDEMVEWQHPLNGHEYVWTPGVGDEQGGLGGYHSWAHKELNTTEEAREFQKNIYFCFIDYAKAFDCVDHNKQWKILKEMRIPDHLTCVWRNLYAGQEAAVRTGHGTTDWFQIEKEYIKAVYCHPAYLTSMQSTS